MFEKTLQTKSDNLEESDKSPSNHAYYQRSYIEQNDTNSCFSPLLSANTKTSNKSRTILKTDTFQYKE